MKVYKIYARNCNGSNCELKGDYEYYCNDYIDNNPLVIDNIPDNIDDSELNELYDFLKNKIKKDIEENKIIYHGDYCIVELNENEGYIANCSGYGYSGEEYLPYIYHEFVKNKKKGPCDE